jgi:hypothetical protein
VVGRLEEWDNKGAVQSMELINNSLGLLVGYQSGELRCVDFQSLKEVCVGDGKHLVKQDEGVTCLTTLWSDESVPLFLSGGADGTIKLIEHIPFSKEIKSRKEEEAPDSVDG